MTNVRFAEPAREVRFAPTTPVVRFAEDSHPVQLAEEVPVVRFAEPTQVRFAEARSEVRFADADALEIVIPQIPWAKVDNEDDEVYLPEEDGIFIYNEQIIEASTDDATSVGKTVADAITAGEEVEVLVLVNGVLTKYYAA